MENKNKIDYAVYTIVDAFKRGKKLLVCGNGGSASDSEHICGELLKSFKKKRPLDLELPEELKCLEGSLPAISLVSNSAVLTAITNDIGGDYIFAQQVVGFGNAGDVLFAISTSGNSIDVIHAVQIAKLKGMKTIGLSGKNGGKLLELCDICIVVPEDETYKIQEQHLPIYHEICLRIEEEMFKE